MRLPFLGQLGRRSWVGLGWVGLVLFVPPCVPSHSLTPVGRIRVAVTVNTEGCSPSLLRSRLVSVLSSGWRLRRLAIARRPDSDLDA